MTPTLPSQRAILTWSEPAARVSDHRLLGDGPHMQAFRRLLVQVAPYDMPVLLVGEESTGKRLAAEVIHDLSACSAGPFVIFDCAAFPQMVHSIQLFGCAAGICDWLPQGVPGMLELAQGGTLFLRDVGQMPTWAQSRLLRTLETRRAERLGATEGISVNVRIIAAMTSPGLLDKPEIGECVLADLRMGGGFLVPVPPLRERGQDIHLLSQLFLRQAIQETGREVRGFRKDALVILERYPWPGNLRELRQCIWGAVMEATRYVTADHLPRHVRAGIAPVHNRQRIGLHWPVRREEPLTHREH